MKINYLIGDATNPNADRSKIIVLICNDIGKWGKGFVLAISKRWKSPEKIYKEAFSGSNKPSLGEVQFIPVEPDIYIANLIGKKGIRSPKSNSPAPIRYDAHRSGSNCRICTHAMHQFICLALGVVWREEIVKKLNQ